MKNLKLIGTSHIAIESIKEIEEAFISYDPDLVAVELDKRRLLTLISKPKKQRFSFKGIFEVGIQGYIFYLIGHWAEKKLGDIVQVKPGSDMITAVNLARKNKKEIALIDQDIQITLKRLSKGISWREKWNFIVDLFNGLVLRKKEKIDFDLNAVPTEKVIKKLISKTKRRYPNVIRILVKERNEVMARKLALILKTQPDKKIMAVIGAGHEDEILSLIKKYMKNIEIPDVSAIAKQSGNNVSYTYTHSS
ncbi:TraB/GumN family protein [Candidatus Woesearchaeota archaeon]|nr:TraB/GumN family protein [Candidatus Woesearchaeota archaeon]